MAARVSSTRRRWFVPDPTPSVGTSAAPTVRRVRRSLLRRKCSLIAPAARTVTSRLVGRPSMPSRGPRSLKQSTSRKTWASSSVKVDVTCRVPVRIDTGQWMRRSRSPGWNRRIVLNSRAGPGPVRAVEPDDATRVRGRRAGVEGRRHGQGGGVEVRQVDRAGAEGAPRAGERDADGADPAAAPAGRRAPRGSPRPSSSSAIPLDGLRSTHGAWARVTTPWTSGRARLGASRCRPVTAPSRSVVSPRRAVARDLVRAVARGAPRGRRRRAA